MRTTRIGIHPYNTSLFVLSRRGTLEATLPDVRWVSVSGTDTGRALREDEIDFTGTGSTPPLAALADGADVVYAAISEPRPEHGALVVREDSPIRSLADLRGKRIGLGIGSYQSTLLAFALDRVGLTWQDVEAVPGNGRPGAEAFRSGELDAWIGGDPHLAEVQRTVGVRQLVDTDELISNRSVWFARRDFAQERPEAFDAIVAALQETDAWIAANPREAAALLARELDGDHSVDAVDSLEAALVRRPWGLHPLTDEYVEEQQRSADLLHRNGQLARPIVVADAVVQAIGERVAALPPIATSNR